MGVTSLWDILGPTSRPVRLESLSKKKLAVDASIWIYQFLKAVRDGEGNVLPQSHIIGFFRRICKLLYFGILPVFVFDGGSPALKRKTILKRRDKMTGNRESVQQLAHKLLRIQVQRQADENFRKRQKTKNSDNEIKYFEDLPNINSEHRMHAPGSSSDETVTFRKKDEYHLPEIKEFKVDKEDTRIIPEEEYEESKYLYENLDSMDFASVDPNSAEFLQLPLSSQFTILSNLRLKSRLRMGYNKEQLSTIFPDDMDFSKFQIQQVKKRNFYTQKLFEVSGMSERGASDQIVSGEKDKKYILVRNENGWSLALSHEGSTLDTAIDVADEQPISKEEKYVFKEQNASAVQENFSRPSNSMPQSDDDDIEWEDVSLNEPGIEEESEFQKALIKSLYSGYASAEETPSLSSSEKKMNPVGHNFKVSKSNVRSDLSEKNNLAVFQSTAEDKHISDNKIQEVPGPESLNVKSDSQTSSILDKNVSLGFSWLLDNESRVKNKIRQDERLDVGSEHLISDSRESEDGYRSILVPERQVATANDKPSNDELSDTEPNAVLQKLYENIYNEDDSNTISTFNETKNDNDNEKNNVNINNINISNDNNNNDNNDNDNNDNNDNNSNNIVKSDITNSNDDTDNNCKQTEVPSNQSKSKVSSNEIPEWFKQDTAQYTDNSDFLITRTERDKNEDGLISWSEAREIIEKQEKSPENEPIILDSADELENVNSFSENQVSDSANRGQDFVLEDNEIDVEGNKKNPIKKESEPTSNAREPLVYDYYFDENDEKELLNQMRKEQEAHVNFEEQISNSFDNKSVETAVGEEQLLREKMLKAKRDSDEVTQTMIRDVQELLKRFGIPYITAPMEAEAQCAELLKLNLVDGIITDDNDCFLFGGEKIYKNMFHQKQYVECYMSEDISYKLGLDQDKLIELALLLGSDYTDGVKGIGPVLAMEIIAEFGTLEKFKNWFDETSVKKKTAVNPLEKTLLNRIKTGKLFLNDSFPDKVVFEAYKHPQVDKDRTPFVWDVPSLDQIRSFLMYNLNWTQSKVDEIMIPLIRDINKKKREDLQSTIEEFYTQESIKRSKQIKISDRIKNAAKKLSNNIEL